jgi:hypothetical protein
MIEEIKTLEKWEKSEVQLITLDKIDDHLFYYFFDVLPPNILFSDKNVLLFQVPEACNYNENGVPTYSTYIQLKNENDEKDNTYVYLGVMTKKDALLFKNLRK